MEQRKITRNRSQEFYKKTGVFLVQAEEGDVTNRYRSQASSTDELAGYLWKEGMMWVFKWWRERRRAQDVCLLHEKGGKYDVASPAVHSALSVRVVGMQIRGDGCIWSSPKGTSQRGKRRRVRAVVPRRLMGRLRASRGRPFICRVWLDEDSLH